jgi:hypothetical protein
MNNCAKGNTTKETNCGANTILTATILHSLSDVPFSVYYNDVWVARLPVRERYGHSAAMVDESTMAAYRGYSHECEDFVMIRGALISMLESGRCNKLALGRMEQEGDGNSVWL